jgi:tetratricopeptide (TPR) repeat protein
MGALNLSDLTAASIYGDVTDSQSRMAITLGRIDEAEKLAGIVSDIAEKVLAQRPGDLRAMRNRFFSANMQGIVANNHHDLAKAEASQLKAEDAARYYTRFNPADSDGWQQLGTAGREVAFSYMDEGRVTDAIRKARETVALEHDPRNKTGMNASIYWTWANIVRLEAQQGNLRSARSALAETRRTLVQLQKDRAFDPELTQISTLGTDMLEFDVLAAEGDYAAIHARAVDIGDRLAKMKLQAEGNRDFRTGAMRTARVWQNESALRLGNLEEAVTAARDFLDKPLFGRRADLAQIGDSTARAKVRLGQALLGSGQRSEALGPLNEAVAYYRKQLAAGAGETGFRQDFSRALWQLALAQAGDDAGLARRRALLAEAAGQLGGLSLEAQQLVESKELIQGVRAAQAQAGQ